MTIHASGKGQLLASAVIPMTFLTCYARVLTSKRVPGFVMVEILGLDLSPSGSCMTLGTIVAESALVYILVAVGAVVVREGSISCEAHRLGVQIVGDLSMTFFAGNLNVLAG